MELLSFVVNAETGETEEVLITLTPEQIAENEAIEADFAEGK